MLGLSDISARNVSFGLNHYSTKYATGKIVESGKISGFDFVGGGVEQVTEKDGKSIGMSGHNGHPTAGEPVSHAVEQNAIC